MFTTLFSKSSCTGILKRSNIVRLSVRSCSTSCTSHTSTTNEAKPVRVRYAPSPTGSLHLGGLRTALYNYLFARQHKGQCLLRIEDTDRTRLVPEAVTQLFTDLSWGMIEFDEGPAPLTGNHGPYVQSERLPLYQKYVQQLLDSGHAYHCFCSSERLEFLRTSQASKGGATSYDRLCANLPAHEVAAKLAAGESYTIRMRVPQEGTTLVKDVVRGDVVFQNKLIDDQVLMKSDGFPTYHLANIVDDHLMEITHVIRGEEWLPSAPKHVLLYQMFGWEVPVFAHLPLLLREDGAKLSKRFKDASLNYYVEQGYLPEAVMNFVLLLGWHPSDVSTNTDGKDAVASTTTSTTTTTNNNNTPLDPKEALKLQLMSTKDMKKKKQQANKQQAGTTTAATSTTTTTTVASSTSEVYTMEQALQHFDLSRVQKSGATVDLSKLEYFQAQHWKMGLHGNIDRLAKLVESNVSTFQTRFATNTLTEEDISEMKHITSTSLCNDITSAGSTTTAEDKLYVLKKALRTTRDHPCTLRNFVYKTLFMWIQPDITSANAQELKKTFWIEESATGMNTKQVLVHIREFIQNNITQEMCDEHQVDKIVSEFKKVTKAQKISLKELYLPLRYVLSATLEGPGVADQICALGLKETLRRIDHCISIC